MASYDIATTVESNIAIEFLEIIHINTLELDFILIIILIVEV